jgi:gliding motility-associated-like protein
MRKLLLSIAFMCGLTAWAQTPLPQTYATTDFTTDEAHAKIEKCPTDPNPSLTTTKAGNRYTWYKYNETTRLYENPTTSGGQTIPSRSVGKYLCVIEKDVIGADRNLLTAGTFNFECTNTQHRNINNENYWEYRCSDGINYIMKELKCDADDDTYPGGFTCVKGDAFDVKPSWFETVRNRNLDGTNMLVCDGMNSANFKVWIAEGVPVRAGLTYEFSCHVANVDNQYDPNDTNGDHGPKSLPQLQFYVEQGNTTYPLSDFKAPDEIGIFKPFGSSYTPTADGICNIYIQNFTEFDEGNDFAIDDIYFGEPQNGTEYTFETFEIAEKYCGNTSTDSKTYTPCVGTTCSLSPKSTFTTGTATWTDASGTAFTNLNISITSLTTLEYTCTIETTGSDNNPLIITETHTINPRDCSSTAEKLYAACSGETCYLAPITTTGTATWTDADGNAVTSTAIVTSGTNDMVFTCTVVTTDSNGDPLTITETHTIKIFDCKKEYTPCAGSQVQLETKNEGTYEWNTGETNKTLVVTASNVVDQADTYTCRITIAGTPNNISFTETHKVFATSCTNTDDFEICKETDLRLTPSKTGNRYNWTLNGTPVTLPQELDGTITINHSTVTPENTPLEYICEIYEMANTAGAPSLANNIIENGDFENTTRDANGNFAGFTSGYNYNSTFQPGKSLGLPYPGYYRLVTSPTSGVLPEPVVGGNSYLECDGHSDLNESGDAYIAKITEPIVRGLEYQFAFSAVATNTTNTPKLTFSLVALDENNNVISTYPLIAEQSITNTTWQQYGVGTYWTAPDDFHHAEIRLSNSVLEAAGNDFGLDNILFQRVYRSTATINTLVRKDIYSVTVTDCTEEEEREDTFLIGSTITLKSEITGGQTYLWYNYNDEPIKDANGNHIGASSIEIVIQDNSNIAEINNYYCVVTMPAGSNPTQVTEFITLNLFEPIKLEPCQFDTITLVPTLEGAISESWYRLTTYNDLSQKVPLLNVVSSEYTIDCQTLVPFLDFEYGNNSISLVRTIQDANGTYRDEQWNLIVGKCQETKAPVVKSICEGQSYTWNNTPYTTTTQKTNVYKEKRENKNWEITESLNLTVNPNPEFEVFVEGRTASIETNSDFTLITLDNQNKGTETEFTWLPVGDHTIKMTDSNTCSSEKSFSIIPKPLAPMVFFTPNDDTQNDKWLIDGIEFYPEAFIQIYDRYSRLLKTFRGIDFEGWDGMYNGHPMPMDDYWYVIMIPESTESMSGHFILKR